MIAISSKSEARNPCLRRSGFAQAGEIPNNLKLPKFKILKMKMIDILKIWSFEFVSSFDIRISNFSVIQSLFETDKNSGLRA